MASRYDDLFNKMTNGTNYMDKVNGSGYSESKKNFGYNTEGKQLYDLNKKSPDSYTPAPGYSMMIVCKLLKMQEIMLYKNMKIK